MENAVLPPPLGFREWWHREHDVQLMFLVPWETRPLRRGGGPVTWFWSLVSYLGNPSPTSNVRRLSEFSRSGNHSLSPVDWLSLSILERWRRQLMWSLLWSEELARSISFSVVQMACPRVQAWVGRLPAGRVTNLSQAIRCQAKVKFVLPAGFVGLQTKHHVTYHSRAGEEAQSRTTLSPPFPLVTGLLRRELQTGRPHVRGQE